MRGRLSAVLVCGAAVLTALMIGGAALRDTVPETASPTAVDALVSELSVREKVGQLFIVRPEDLDGTSVTALTEQTRAALEQYPVGGVIMFAPNIDTPEQITAFNRALQEASPIPLFIAVDEEGGPVSRLANAPGFDLPQYPGAAAVAAGGVSAALEMGRTIGAYLAQYGFNMDFAPDADVNTNPDNPVIGDRAFSPDAAVAADMAQAMAEGLRWEQIIPVFKHFPGHGDTAEDSHTGTAVAYKTKEEMRLCEWLPFSRAGDLDGIMVGHITAPNLTDDGMPATLSRQAVTDILREELGFRGLVVTDALRMGAITQTYGPETAAVMAFSAGCDVLLMPDELPGAFQAIIDAVESGQISEARLDESVRRILQFKSAYGLLQP